MRNFVALSLIWVASSSQSKANMGEIYVSQRMPSHPVYFGDPAQFFSMGVSTSSDFTSIPCEGCMDCEKRPGGFYNITKSNSLTQLPCQACQGGDCIADRCAVGRSTMDESLYTGYEVKDYGMAGGMEDVVVDIEDTDAGRTRGFELFFVCQTTAYGYFKQMSGILGLTTAPTSFLSQLYQAGKIEKPRFSLCFRENTKLEYSNDRGLVRFGGYVESTLDSEMVYAKRIQGYSHRVNIKNIFLRENGGNTVLTHSNQKIVTVGLPSDSDNTMILDSAIPFLSFDVRFENEFKAKWKDLTGHQFTKSRQDLTIEQVWGMPTILIELEGAKGTDHDVNPESVASLTDDYNVLIAIPAIHYMEHMPLEDKPYRTRLNFDSKSGSIFGLNAMTGHTISYEPDSNRIGFAESKTCIETGEESDESWRGRGSGEDSNSSNGHIFKANTGAMLSSTATDDDIFASKTEALDEESKQEIDSGITCFTASCRSLMAMGYVFIGTALAVVYRVSRPKERQDNMMQATYDEPHIGSTNDDLNSAYRRKPWNEPASMLI